MTMTSLIQKFINLKLMRLSLESCTSLDCLVSCHIGYSCELMFLVACLNTIKLGRRQDQCYLFIHM